MNIGNILYKKENSGTKLFVNLKMTNKNYSLIWAGLALEQAIDRWFERQYRNPEEPGMGWVLSREVKYIDSVRLLNCHEFGVVRVGHSKAPGRLTLPGAFKITIYVCY
ncbi:hypothetical protein [Gynuella sunshinyii]|uniref:Thioesterase n=1 Tax=Gynuella sunshinyii YC6258 TaxID=1445510 RepID=A0A0C5VQ93_9GAMM|nr:hypothetical protein [Gynuella sunshinyii]AJQ92454.1 hypothetical Protein YC6258_00404 [Gynuella sunshinyii YC6258]